MQQKGEGEQRKEKGERRKEKGAEEKAGDGDGDGDGGETLKAVEVGCRKTQRSSVYARTPLMPLAGSDGG